MIFGSENISTFSKSNMAIWHALAIQGGILNAGGFLACGYFVSHLSGYLTLSPMALYSESLSQSMLFLLPVFTFFLGAFFSGILIDRNLRGKGKPKYYLVFGILFISSAVLSLKGEDLFGPFSSQKGSFDEMKLLLFLSFLCGLQNGMITLVSKAIVRTTHVTGLITDLGIGVSRELARRDLTELNDERRSNLMRIGIIVFFFFGSLIGFYTFDAYSFAGFGIPALISGTLFGLTLFFQLIKKT